MSTRCSKMLRSAVLCVCCLFFLATGAGAIDKNFKLGDFLGADIDWQQAQGKSITVLTYSSPEAEYLGEQLDIFERLTGVKVDYNPIPYYQLHEKALVDLVSGSGQYDVFDMDYMFTPLYAGSNFVEPLDPYLNIAKYTDADWYKKENIFDVFWNAVSYKGKVYAIPFTAEASFLMYRSDLLEEKGLTVPQTFDDLWKTAQALNDPPKMYGIGLRGQRGAGLNIYTWTQFLRGMGGKFFADYPEDMMPVVNSPDAVRATQYYADIMNKFGPPGGANWTNVEVYTALQTNRIAMTMDATAYGPIIDDPKMSETAGKWGYALVVGGKGGRWSAPYCHTLAMNADSKKKVASWLFMQWATSPIAVLKRGIVTGVPARVPVWDNPQFEEGVAHVGHGTYAKFVRESLEIADADYRPRFAAWKEMGDLLGIAVQSVIAGETAQAALDKAQKDIVILLTKTRYLQK